MIVIQDIKLNGVYYCDILKYYCFINKFTKIEPDNDFSNFFIKYEYYYLFNNYQLNKKVIYEYDTILKYNYVCDVNSKEEFFKKVEELKVFL